MIYFNIRSDTNYILKALLITLILFLIIFIIVKFIIAFLRKITIEKKKRLKKQELLNIIDDKEISEEIKFKKISKRLDIKSSYEIGIRANVGSKYILELISKKEFGLLNRLIYNEIIKKNE